MALRTLIAITLVAGLAGPAAADDARPVRWQRGFGFAGGAAQIGDLGFANIGLQARLGRRVSPRVHLGLTAELLNTNRGDGAELVMGETTRAMLGAEYDLNTPDDGSLAIRGVAIGGAGGELITWERGYAARPFGFVGAEVQMRFEIDDGGFFQELRSMGFRAGVRFQVAPSIPSHEVPMRCTIGCEPYPAADRTDVAFVIYQGLDFGL
jgi:hypothetical protein